MRLLALLAQCWTHLRSDGLAGEFASWLFGSSSNEEEEDQRPSPELRGVVTHQLKHALLGLCTAKDQVGPKEPLHYFKASILQTGE